jgi:hypothetical protein
VVLAVAVMSVKLVELAGACSSTRLSVNAASDARWIMYRVSFSALSVQVKATDVELVAAAARAVGVAGMEATVMTCVATLVPRALVAVSVTGKMPAAAKVCAGLWRVDRALPSPKFHDQLVGTPVVVSVNLTARGGWPMDGVAAKEATGMAGTGGVTVMIWDDAPEPRALVASSVTVKVPAVRNVWVGLATVTAGLASPKFHEKPVGTPADVSVKVIARGAAPVVGVKMKWLTGVAGTPAVTGSTFVIVDAGPTALFTVRLTVKVPAVV